MPDELPLIAVLDDEARMRTALGRLLRTRGYGVQLCEDGMGLLVAIENRPVACIVLDLHMPGANGFDILATLARRNAHPPVIVITGHDQPGNAERVGQLGACAYLTKPVDEAPLLRAIETALRDHSAAA